MRDLIFKRVHFYSPQDEARFFNWLENIPGVSEVYGHLDSIIAVVDEQKVDDESLEELLAIHHRYNTDMSQLKSFLTEQNRHWFHDIPTAYWHEKVFGTAGQEPDDSE
jgi:hypothetical protein